MKRSTPYAAGCLVLVLVLALIGMPALAGYKSTGGDQAGPGETVTIPIGRGTDYTELTLANQGPGDAQAVIDSTNYDDSIMIEAGGEVTITKIFGPGGTKITNESATSTITITFRIRSTSSSR